MSWASRVYAVDKAAAHVCTMMQQHGFAFDRERAAELSSHLRGTEQQHRRDAEQAVGRSLRATATGGFGADDLQDAFFRDLRAPVYFRSALTGRPSLGVDALRGYAACSDERLRALSLAILGWRRARKVRTTYLDNVVVSEAGRVHATWLNYGAISGRFSCQGPNLMNLPRAENDPTCEIVEGGVRSCYVAPPGYVLVGADAKQIEMRVAAYASGDAAMIAACLSSDVHAANASVIFGADFDADAYAELKRLDKVGNLTQEQSVLFARLEALRSLAKSAAFAVCYMAEAATVYARIVAAGINVRLTAVEAMLRKLRRGFATYYRWQDGRLLDCVRNGWTDDPVIGRRRWLGHDPPPPECANFPIQGGAAAIMNTKLPGIVSHLRDVTPETKIIAQVHDAMYFEAREADADKVKAAMIEAFDAPVHMGTSGLDAVFPLDVKVRQRWA